MAQTTSATSAVNAFVEFSTNGSSWTDVSGFANKIDAPSGKRTVGDTPTFAGDTHIVTGGKRPPVDVKASFVYTEGASDAWAMAKTAYEAGSAFYIRWSPKAATTGNFRYTTDSGIISDFDYPNIDAADGKPIMASLTLHTPKVTEAAIP